MRIIIRTDIIKISLAPVEALLPVRTCLTGLTELAKGYNTKYIYSASLYFSWILLCCLVVAVLKLDENPQDKSFKKIKTDRTLIYLLS